MRDTKERIQSEALRLFAENGYHAVTVEQIAADKSTGEELLDIFMVAKYLERIGDHATNLAEWVEYAQTGARSKNGHWVSPEAQATGWI